MLNYILAIPLIAHGLANITGFVAAWTGNPSGFTDSPLLFSSSITMQTGIGRAFGVMWLLSTIVLVGAGIGVAAHQRWWRPAAIIGAAFSMVAIVPWWDAVPPGARFGALFDLLVIVMLLSSWGRQLAHSAR